MSNELELMATSAETVSITVEGGGTGGSSYGSIRGDKTEESGEGADGGGGNIDKKPSVSLNKKVRIGALKSKISAAVKKVNSSLNQTSGSKKVLQGIDDMRRTFDKSTFFRPTRIAIAFVILYVILGILYYHYKNDITWIDSTYLVVITLMTVGYGDIPIDDTGFTSFYVLTGTGVVGAAFLTIMSQIIERQETHVHKSLKQARLNRLRKSLSHKVDMSNIAQEAITSKVESLISQIDSMGGKESKEAIHDSDYYSPENLRKREQEIYQGIITKLIHRTIAFFGLVLLVIFVGSLCFWKIEAAQGLTYKDSIYWAIVTICTVGFGDVTPDTDGGKAFTILYCLFSIPLAGKAFSEIAKFPVIYKQKRVETETINQFGISLTPELLNTLLSNPFFDNEHIPHLRVESAKEKGEITKPEFLLLVLSLMGRVTDKDLHFASHLFERFDHDHSGAIGKEDLVAKLRLGVTETHKRLSLNSNILADDLGDSFPAPHHT